VDSGQDERDETRSVTEGHADIVAFLDGRRE
jgi:hypothetical protein